jgi:hypothetical protein
MTGYYSRANELQEIIEESLKKQGIGDPKLREEMARQRINTLRALGRFNEAEGHRRYYGRGATEIYLMELQTSNLPKLDQETYLNSRRMAHPSLIPLPKPGYSDGKRR